MDTKTIEVLDRGTFVPMLAIRLNPTCEADSFLFARGGFGGSPSSYVLLMRLSESAECRCDPSFWGGRTMPTAHRYIIEHWDELESGQVVDVEFILGESKEPKVSEKLGELDLLDLSRS